MWKILVSGFFLSHQFVIDSIMHYSKRLSKYYKFPSVAMLHYTSHSYLGSVPSISPYHILHIWRKSEIEKESIVQPGSRWKGIWFIISTVYIRSLLEWITPEEHLLFKIYPCLFRWPEFLRSSVGVSFQYLY